MSSGKKAFIKRRIYSILKILLIVIVFCLYFLILLRATMASMEDGKFKTSKLIDHATLHRLHKGGVDVAAAAAGAAGADDARNANKLNSGTNSNNRIHKTHNDASSRGKNQTMTSSTTSTIASATKTKKIPSTTLNPIYEYSEELNAAAEMQFNERKAKLWDECMKYNIVGKYPPNAWEFFISPGHGITWCNVFKAASSTWMYYFNILGGYNLKYLQRTKASPLELARKRFPRPTQTELNEALSNSISFLTVRDPFERLLSAYRNKLEGFRNKYYKILGKQIVKKFRHEKSTTTNNNNHNYSKMKHISGPTFSEFLKFLVNHHASHKHFDEHWTPIYTFCTPCSINFTLIAKVETFQRDTEYIIRQAGLETLLLNKLPQQKVKWISNRSQSDTKALIPIYFSQIDDDLLRDVLKIYEPDFVLFGYNSSKYFDYVQIRNTTGM